MESYIFTPLPPLFLNSPPHLSEKLPEFRPLFSVPPLEGRPQNPIVELPAEESPPPCPPQREENSIGTKSNVQPKRCQEHEEDTMWTNTHAIQRACKIFSWDALRPTPSKHTSSTPFLSEQSNDVFEAVRHHVQPRLNDPSLLLRYILPTELLDHLLINVVGNSSPLFIWDPKSEQLVSCRTGDHAKLLVIIEGLDDVASAVIIERFLNIGTLLRRLESLVMMQRQTGSPTLHTFLHALSTILVHIRTSLTERPPHSAFHLTSLWVHYADTEATLSALAVLCYLGQSPPYKSLPSTPAGLLSHVYELLELHIERKSSRTITAMLAYILTISSRDYFNNLGESLGMFEPSRAWLHTAIHFNARDRYLASENDMEYDQTSISNSSDDLEQDHLPSFIPKDLAEGLPVARKSLRILQTADPDHPLCRSPVVENCEWVWSTTDVERLWLCEAQSASSGGSRDTTKYVYVRTDTPATPIRDYGLELEQFGVYDLEPGAHLAKLTTSSSPTSNPSLLTFLASFPERLPPLTPKLQHLATVVLQPLFMRTAALSNSLLRLYLTSLQLETHLVILRSYLLATFAPFRMRLVDALFSDGDENRHMGRGLEAGTRASLGIRDSHNMSHNAASPGGVQGIGLGHGLAGGNTWPPGGADLSFFLRRVIVESLEERNNAHRGENVKTVWTDVEVRLGFALRNLPVDDGRERWLNPMSIEALDFLYLDYKPPHPLDIVITPNILSKYQRTFIFLLRLFRAEIVMRIVYRSTFKAECPVFSYAPEAQRILVCLRFQIQTFVGAFITYVFDSVIGGEYETYLQRITELRKRVAADNQADYVDQVLTDVFALRDSHSQLLDRILGGCLLRTAQKVAGDALRDLLETTLQFGALITNVRGGFISQADGAVELSDIYLLFQKQMLVFIKAIEAMHVKEQVNDGRAPSVQADHLYVEEIGHRAEYRFHLKDLLTRIDPMHWWRRKFEERVHGIEGDLTGKSS